jgi:hypothetical protein
MIGNHNSKRYLFKMCKMYGKNVLKALHLTCPSLISYWFPCMLIYDANFMMYACSSEDSLKDTTQSMEHVAENELKSAAACFSLTSVN